MKGNKGVCIVCKGEDTSSLEVFGGKKVRRCQNCFLEWRVPVISVQEFKRLYCKEYFAQEGKLRVGYPDYDFFIDSFREYYFRELRRILRAYPQKGVLVDVGCGPGIFLNEAKKMGFKVLGVDISEIAVKKAWQRYGIQVMQKEFEECGFENNSLDIVTCFQTFEHMRQPLKFLKKVYGSLKPSGLLVLTTPNTNSFWRKILGKGWFSYRHQDHLSFWQRKPLLKALERSGFEAVEVFSDDWRMYNAREILALVSAYGGKLDFKFSQVNLGRLMEKLRLPVPVGSIRVVAKKTGKA